MKADVISSRNCERIMQPARQILAMVGIQPEAIALVLGVDRFLDMCRTTLNVVGDLVAAQVISAGEPDDAAPQPA